MNSTIFWDTTQFIPLKVSRRFGETYRLHLQGEHLGIQRATGLYIRALPRAKIWEALGARLFELKRESLMLILKKK
jgi:hypothetical protein